MINLISYKFSEFYRITYFITSMKDQYTTFRQMISGVNFLFWLSAFAWWLLNNRSLNNAHVKGIHHILSFALFFKTTLSIFSIDIETADISSNYSNY